MGQHEAKMHEPKSISYVDKSGAIAYVVCNLDEDSDEIELRTPMDYCSYGEREEANT